MICPECLRSNSISTIYESETTSTAAYFAPIYDENGKRHYHDLNRVLAHFYCSNGHRWSEELTNTCWCGWKSK